MTKHTSGTAGELLASHAREVDIWRGERAGERRELAAPAADMGSEEMDGLAVEIEGKSLVF